LVALLLPFCCPTQRQQRQRQHQPTLALVSFIVFLMMQKLWPYFFFILGASCTFGTLPSLVKEYSSSNSITTLDRGTFVDLNGDSLVDYVEYACNVDDNPWGCRSETLINTGCGWVTGSSWHNNYCSSAIYTPREVMNIKEAATFLRISEKEFEFLLENKQIVGRKINTEWLIHKQSIVNYLMFIEK
jgi:hypothetical protein